MIRDPRRADRRRGRRRRPQPRASRPRSPSAASSACCSSTRAPPAPSATIEPVIEQAHELGAVVTVAADLLALTLLTSPGELGADIAVGTTPALRRADGLRRPARRLHGRAREARAQPARPARRRLRGRRRQPGVPPRPADPRAAHPPREGHQQHLHRAGAARRHGRHVRGLPRPRRAAGDRPPHPPLRRRSSPRACAAGGVEVVHGAFFDTVTARVPGPGRRGRRRRPRGAASTCASSTPTTSSHRLRRDHRRAPSSPPSGPPSASSGDIEALDARADDALPGGAAAHRRRT